MIFDQRISDILEKSGGYRISLLAEDLQKSEHLSICTDSQRPELISTQLFEYIDYLPLDVFPIIHFLREEDPDIDYKGDRSGPFFRRSFGFIVSLGDILLKPKVNQP